MVAQPHALGSSGLQTQAEFARLCAISHQMVSKYAADGRLVRGESGLIDAEASLQQLAGHLDEQKRLTALEKLRFAAPGAAQDTQKPPPGSSGKGAKGELDEIRRDLARLELEQKAGNLVAVAAVEERAFNAIAAMRQALESTRRETSERLASDLGLTPDRAPVIARALQRYTNAAQAAFVQILLETGADDAGDVAAHVADPPEAHQVAAE